VMSILGATHPTGPRNAQLMTMRKAKGLEADVVMMVGLEDDIVPGHNCDDLSEAARLFYVSMTRAKQKLFLFHSFSRPRNISYGDDLTHKRRSRFLDAIGRASEYKNPG
jgi:superfamily I DNA/RNA helicase